MPAPDRPLFPVTLVVAGKRCLVVGGGRVAAAKVRQLVACGALVHVVAPTVDPSIAGEAEVAIERRPYEATDIAGHRLVFAATSDPAVNRSVHDDAEAAGVWVNSADDPANCTFMLPAVARRGPLSIAVSTSGRSPALATWLRRRYEAELGPEYEILADLLSSERAALRAAGRSTEGLDWQSALDAGMLDLIRAGEVQVARERMTVSDSRLPKALADLLSRDHITEAVVLSTCMRTEVYAVAERYHGAVQDVRNFLAELSFRAPEEFADHLYTFHDEAAVGHLFRVASGLDSAVLGEGEVLGQVKAAWQSAMDEGAAGPVLAGLFRHAVGVGKRARAETAIARGTTSVSQAAVEMAERELGSLDGRRILVLGAGDMGEGMVAALGASGAGEILVANRSATKAAALARKVGGRSVALGALITALADVDVLLTSTGSPSVLVEAADLADVLEGRDGRPLLVVDIAVPRDVDPGVRELEGVTLLDMEDLAAFAAAGVEGRRQEVANVEAIIADEVVRHAADATARQAAPLVAALHDRAEALRQAELDRQASRLTPEQAAAADAVSRALIKKLLHEPTIRLKDAAGSPRGERLADALRDLFDLES
jgi:glutamyl-tRNA reductase